MDISAARLRAMRWCLLWGNFFIGCGVMVVGGALNDISADLHVSVSTVGQLIAVAAVMMGTGAPIMATVFSHIDRRYLLSGALVWYGAGHLLCAFCPQYDWLLPVRALTVLAAAVFTPQAAAAMGLLTPLASRGRAITFVFLGWSLAAVVGMPLAAWIGERLGWQVAMGLVGVGSLLVAVVVFRTLPRGLMPPATSLGAWKAVLSSPVLLGTVLVTALQSAGQMTMVAYSAAYLKTSFGANPEQISTLLAYFGAMSMLGVLLLNRWVDRITPPRAVNLTLCLMWVSMFLWPMAATLPVLALVMLPWAISGFATSSGQQARLSSLSPSRAPALMSLNTSAIYLGHAAGAAGGSWVIEHHGYAALHWPALVWSSLAIALSVWAYRASLKHPPEPPVAKQLV
jgi:MFS transporter, DHA1 family, inner membrane transport protein